MFCTQITEFASEVCLTISENDKCAEQLQALTCQSHPRHAHTSAICSLTLAVHLELETRHAPALLCDMCKLSQMWASSLAICHHIGNAAFINFQKLHGIKSNHREGECLTEGLQTGCIYTQQEGLHRCRCDTKDSFSLLKITVTFQKCDIAKNGHCQEAL